MLVSASSEDPGCVRTTDEEKTSIVILTNQGP